MGRRKGADDCKKNLIVGLFDELFMLLATSSLSISLLFPGS